MTVAAAAGTEVTDLNLVYDPSDQPDGTLPAGIHITPGAPVPLLSGGQAAALSAVNGAGP